MNWEFFGRQPLARAFRKGNIDRAYSRRTQETTESLEEQRPDVEARSGQNTPREQSPTSMMGEGRPQPRQTMTSAFYCLNKGLALMAYTLTSKWEENWRVSSVASCEWIRTAGNISWI
jgi:hypothetical protein